MRSFHPFCIAAEAHLESDGLAERLRVGTILIATISFWTLSFLSIGRRLDIVWTSSNFLPAFAVNWKLSFCLSNSYALMSVICWDLICTDRFNMSVICTRVRYDMFSAVLATLVFSKWPARVLLGEYGLGLLAFTWKYGRLRFYLLFRATKLL